MTYAFLDLLHKSMMIFIDDFSVQSKAIDHLSWIKEVLTRCYQIGIAINPEKFYLAVRWGALLGHIIPQAKKESDLEKVEVIVELHPPKDLSGVRKVLRHMD